ncbi:MAG: hypothetical protein D3926_11230 [Desulfobacteraceae bacterium]|nr:MAG: hypothetical protein D3926_11230 [Desulfobacteraceae bacterium]
MRKKTLTSIRTLIIMLVFAAPAIAAMSSPNYTMEKSVLSCGGTAMGSASYQMAGTLGQPSPIGICSSRNYINCPGFWAASKLEIKRIVITWIQLLLLDD